MNLRLMFIKAFLRTCKLPRHFPMKLPNFFQRSEKLQVCLSMHEPLLPPHIKGLKKTVRGQSAITSLSLIWKYITAGKRNITRHRMLINYFPRWNVTCNTQQYVITQKSTTKNKVWHWHLFLHSLYHFIQSSFEK